MSKSVNAANVDHALDVRAAIVRAVYARWPSDAALPERRAAIVADAVSIYNAQMIAHSLRKGAELATF
jgi:hypothetical protein